jgi:phosphohistidine phosphatase SixA
MSINHSTTPFLALIVALAMGLSIGKGQAKEPNFLPAPKALELLKTGGYILYFRHFETGADTPDQIKAQIGDCATQRQLNARGASQAIAVRDAVQKNGLPVSTIYASPFCRAWQSADLAFGKHTLVDGLKLPPAKDYSPEQTAQMKSVLLPLLTASVPAGGNVVIMAHDDNLPASGGPEIKQQGEAVVIKPTAGNGFEVVGHIAPKAWYAMAKLGAR